MWDESLKAPEASWQKKGCKIRPELTFTLTHPTPLQNPLRTSFSKSSPDITLKMLRQAFRLRQRSILQQVHFRSTHNTRTFRTLQTMTRKTYHSASIAKPLTGLQIRFMTIATPLLPLTSARLSMTRSTIFDQRWRQRNQRWHTSVTASLRR